MTLEARLIDLGKKDGKFNVNIEIPIIESTAQGKVQPTLVFTEWEPTVLVGNSQSLALDVDSNACDRHNVNVLRRNSGGQSVYLNEGYLVFALIGKKEDFDWGPEYVRRSVSNIVSNTLNSFGVPSEFAEPDNVIIKENGQTKTIGNAGQVFKQHAILAQGSIRYKLSQYDTMLDVLKINGHKLHPYSSEIKNVLRDVVTYAPTVTKQEIKQKLAENFAKAYDLNFTPGNLTIHELARVNELSTSEAIANRLQDKPTYSTRGVCYFAVSGENLVPSTKNILGYVRPSNREDSTIN